MSSTVMVRHPSTEQECEIRSEELVTYRSAGWVPVPVDDPEPPVTAARKRARADGAPGDTD